MIRGGSALEVMLNPKINNSGEFQTVIDNLACPFLIFEVIKNDEVSNLVCSYINKSGLDDIQLAEEEVIGKRLKEIFPEDPQTLFQVCSQVIEDKATRKTQLTYSNKSGKRKRKRAFDVSISKLNEGVTLSWKVLKDGYKNEEKLLIQKTEFEVLQYTDELFFKAFHANPDSYIISRVSDGKILEVNRSAVILFQYSKDEMIGRTSAELGLIANMNDRERAVSLLKENGFVRDFTMTIVRKSGEIRQVSLAVEIIDIGDEKLMMTSVRDITERMKTEEALRQSEERFFKAFITSPYAMTITKLPEGIWTDVNDGFLKLTGYNREELIGHTSVELNMVIEQEPEQRTRIINSIAAKGNVTDEEIKIRTKRGGILHVILSAVIVKLDGQNFAITQHVDITKRKKAEEKLRKSQEILSLILNHVNEGIIVSEAPDGKAVAISRWGANYTVGRSVDAIIDLSVESYLEQWDVRDINTREKIQPERLPVYRALRGEVIQGEEILIVRPDGTDFIILANAVPIYNEDKSRIVNVISTWTDITERKKAEEASLARMTELETILDSIADGVIIYDNNGKIVRLNAAADEILKYPEADRERTMLERVKERYGVWSEDGIKLTPDEMPAVRASVYGETIKGVLLGVQGAGEPRWVVASAVPLFVSGKQIGAVASLTNITDRKKAEEALRKSEQRFRTLMMASSEVLYRMSPDWSEMSQLIGRGFLMDTDNPNPNWLQEYIHPDDQHQVMNVINEAIKNKSTFELEHRVRQLDGSWGWTYSRAVPLMDANGKIIEWFGAAADFTKRKLAEEALRTSEAQLDAFFANSPNQIQFFNDNLCYINADKFTAKYYNVTREEIKGKCLQDLNPQQYGKYRKDFERTLYGGEIVIMEHSNPSPDKPEEMLYWITSQFRVPIGNGKWGLGQINIDITDIKRSEQKLRESEERFSKAFVVNPSALIISRIEDGLIIDINEAFLKIFGYTRDEVIGKTYSDLNLTKPEERDVVIDQLRSNGFIRDVEMKMRRKDGEERIGLFSIETLNTSGGQAILSSIQDITDRKDAEEVIKKAKEQYDLLFYSINEGFAHYKAVYDANGRLYDLLVLEINPAGAALSGVKREDQIGRTWKQVWTGIEDSLFDIYREVDKTGEKFIFEHYSGITQRWYTNRIYKIARDQFAVTFFDITEQKMAEEALQESKTKLLDAQKLAHFGNYTFDIRNNNIEWSDQMYDLWEVDKNKPIPSFGELWNLIHPEDRDHVSKAFAGSNKENEKVETEFRIIFPDKRIKYVELITRIFFDEAGNPIKRQGVEIDITERKEAMLKLERTLRELELSNRDIEQYAYVTSHDLKEPVRMITSYVQLLEKRYKNQLGQDAEVYLNFINEGASRLYLLINDLVNYLQIGITERSFVQVNINEVIDSVLRVLNKTLKENGTKIIYNDMPVISADPQQMRQLFYNLIDNAVKFRSNNEPVIEIKCREDDKEWFFSVKDNGIGIKQEYSEIIFSVFQRLNSREDYKGNGVGLAICKRIIGHHNGRIWVESEQGVGSIFYFTIPKTKRFYESKEKGR